MSEENGTGVSITFKAGTGYDAPWVVLHGASVDHVRSMLREFHDSDLKDGVAQVARQWHGTYAGANPAHAATAANTGAAPFPQSQPAAASTPPPSFVQNQQAQPAGWGTPNATPQQLMQQQLGAQVVAQAPNDVAFCSTHNAARKYYEGGTNRNTQKPYGASWRCPVDGCKPRWQNRDGSWG